MERIVVTGLDGSAESRAAAEWAAREARLRELPLKVVHVWDPVPEPIAQAPRFGKETLRHWSERIPREMVEGLRLRHPGLEVTSEQLPGGPAEVLARVSGDTEMLVLGSRGLSGVGGFMVGSVGLSVVAHAERPVVLVRAGEQAADEHEPDPTGVPSASTAFRPVVLGLDVDSADESLIRFAFEAAAVRGTSLRVVHGWSPSPYEVYSLAASPESQQLFAAQRTTALAAALEPWRAKYPSVEVVEEAVVGVPAHHLVDASRTASLVVVGRRIVRRAFGARIGSVTHALLHHSGAPVAVVAHR
ncbi:universal stress protein [Streptomyces sp. NPDC057877]|uniref:universal stress protein n=1 Tax=Streptomyces sp. NPDC057877 TaxID=3346269 RepID=UPI00367C424C